MASVSDPGRLQIESVIVGDGARDFFLAGLGNDTKALGGIESVPDPAIYASRETQINRALKIETSFSLDELAKRLGGFGSRELESKKSQPMSSYLLIRSELPTLVSYCQRWRRP